MALVTREVVEVAPPVSRWFERRGRSVAVLAAVLIALLLLTDGQGFLSTDVGGKMATLEAMDRRGDLSPDLGYWAEEYDADGSLYPMWSTAHIGDQWVNVTTLPMIYVALPLYRVGGAHAAGLVPIAGTILAALGAAALARRLGGDRVIVFWIVGAASPATVYALDFWEHSLALACMIWAVALALDASRGGGSWRPALAAGLLFGAAAAMRQEALVYGFVTGCALGIRLLGVRRPLVALLRGSAMAAGAGAALALNSLLEWWALGGLSRTERSAGAASAVGSDLDVRLQEVLITLASPFTRVDSSSLALAAITGALLVELGRRSDRPDLPIGPVLVGLVPVASLLLFDLITSGPGFVPGLAAATPVAMLAITRCWSRPDHRFIAAIALGSLPLVWAVQYTGGAVPQWGGRYILLSGALLVALASAVTVSRRGLKVLRGTALAGMAVTLIGVAWTVERTHGFADAMETVAARSEPAIVFNDPHLAREAGALMLDEQWLVASDEDGRMEASEVLIASGIDVVGFVEHDVGGDPTILPGWTIVDETRVPLVKGLHLRITTITAP